MANQNAALIREYRQILKDGGLTKAEIKQAKATLAHLEKKDAPTRWQKLGNMLAAWKRAGAPDTFTFDSVKYDFRG